MGRHWGTAGDYPLLLSAFKKQIISSFLFVTTHQQVDHKHRGSSAASRSRSRPSGRHAPSYTAESAACLHMQASSTSNLSFRVAVVDGGIEHMHRGDRPPRREGSRLSATSATTKERERGGRAALHDTFSSSGCIRSPGAALHAKRGSDGARRVSSSLPCRMIRAKSANGNRLKYIGNFSRGYEVIYKDQN